MAKTCKTCAFYKFPGESEGKKFGFCFRYPPLALSETKSIQAVVMAEKPICGEFKRRWFGDR